MRLKRTATLALLGAAVAAWLAAAATTGRRIASAQPTPQTISDADSDDDLALQVARLHDRLTPVAMPRSPSRDLFRFAAAQPKSGPAPVSASRPAALADVPVSPAVPLRPVLKLAGIAEDVRPDGIVVRTAIIAAQGQLFLVKEGEGVTSRFRVSRIAADVVELTDLADDSTLRLPLK